MEEKVFAVVIIGLLISLVFYLLYLYRKQQRIKKVRVELLKRMREFNPFEKICFLLAKLPNPDKENLFENENDFYFYLQRRMRMSYKELGRILFYSQQNLNQKKYAKIWHYLSYFAINFMSADWLALIYSRAALERNESSLLVIKFIFDVFSYENDQFLMPKNDKFCEFHQQVLEHLDTALHDQIVDANAVKSQKIAFKNKVSSSKLADFLITTSEN